jgi:hypothetical protein
MTSGGRYRAVVVVEITATIIQVLALSKASSGRRWPLYSEELESTAAGTRRMELYLSLRSLQCGDWRPDRTSHFNVTTIVIFRHFSTFGFTVARLSLEFRRLCWAVFVNIELALDSAVSVGV